VDIRRLPWIRRLTSDYAHDTARLSAFFAGDPAEPGAWREAIARAQTHPRDRQRLADLLKAQQDRRGAPAEALAASARLADPRTVAVVTGQQAGLFGGPLFTLLKAVTAVTLARRVSEEHGVPAVAVFWIESEDHDWHEVSSCAVLDADLRRRTVELGTPPGAGEVAVASVRLDPSVVAAIDTLGSILPRTEFTDDVLGALGRAYTPGEGMADAFGRWMESLAGHLGLVVYDASDPAAKPLAGPVFVRELESGGAASRLAGDAGADLVAGGYHAQAVPQADSVALFRLDGGRLPIHRRDGSFLVGDAATVPAATLVDEARREPGRFSPNVLLRPIVQDALFPTVCYVAGPNELAYLAQLKAVYRHFDVPEPLVCLRASATLVDSAAMKFLVRHDLPLEALQPDDEATLNRLLAEQLPPSVEEAFADVSRAVESGMTRLGAAVTAVDPTLEGAARSALGRMQHDLGALHDKIIQAAKRRDATLRRQYGRTRAQAFPDGAPQERSVASVYFLNRYGVGLVDRLHDVLPLDARTHWVLTI
jgi:bacillithiol synthase